MINWLKGLFKKPDEGLSGLSYEEDRILEHLFTCLETGEKHLFDKGDSRVIHSLVQRKILDESYFMRLSAGLYKLI